MRKTFTLAAVALALGAAACGRKQVETTPPPAEQVPAGPDGTVPGANDEVGLTELPGSQAAMVAAAGSDTVYFNTDRYDLDQQSRTTLAAQARWLAANPSVRASIEGTPTSAAPGSITLPLESAAPMRRGIFWSPVGSRPAVC